MKRGIKETKELVDGLKVLSKAGYAIAKDGKVSLDDLEHLVELGKEFETIMDAFKDLGDIDDEMKDLDEAEAIEIVAHLYKAVKEIKEA